MKLSIILIVTVLCFLLSLLPVFPPISIFADMGAIIPVENVNLDEPAQRAIIAYDGFEELLILQTELKPSKRTLVIRFIPLPSLPDVKAVSNDIFYNLKKLVERCNLQYVRQTKSLSQSGITSEKVKIEVKKSIGAHDITVVRATSTEEFLNWIYNFLKSHGYKNKIKNKQDYINIINHYITNKINYFVFDIVNLKSHISIQPIMYTFNSKTLYYPLVATNILRSYGTIELFIFSENGRSYLSSIYGFLPSTTAIVKSEDTSRISPKITELLGRHAILQAFKYRGKLYFDRDIEENPGIILKRTSPLKIYSN